MSYKILDKPPYRYRHPFVDLTEINGEKHFYFGQFMWVDFSPVGGSVKNVYVCILDDGRVVVETGEGELKKVGIIFKHMTYEKPEPIISKRVLDAFVEGKPTNPDEMDAFDLTKKAYETYIDYGDDKYASSLVALYTIQTYLLPIWNKVGYLAFTGIKRSGKSLNLDVAEMLCFNPVKVVDISASSMFRVVEETRATLLIDEADFTTPEKKSALRDILLAGYKRGAKVKRSEKIKGDKIVSRSFEVYGCRMLVAQRGEMEQMLWDRCIPITMQRSHDPSITKRSIDPDDPIWQDIRDHIGIFCLRHWREVKEAYEKLPSDTPGIEGRDYEKWAPILALAKVFDVFDEMYGYALEKIRETQLSEEAEAPEIKLLRVCLHILQEGQLEPRYYSAADVAAKAEELLGKEKWINPSTVGRMLTSIFALNRRPWKIVRNGKPHYKLDYNYMARLARRYNVDPDNPLEA